MASFNETLKLIAEARRLNADAARDLYGSRVKLLKEDKALSAAEASVSLEAQLKAEQVNKEALNQSLAQLYAADSLQALTSNLDGKVPVLLLPLRLETVFKESDGKQELWLRIYPDDIAVQQHETLLTEKEYLEGKGYWSAFFEAERNQTSGEDIKKSAWEQLRTHFGVNRSSWIARQTLPVNWDNRSAIAKKEELMFPELGLLKVEEWTEPPRTQVLPDKFVVSIFKGPVKVHEQTGNLIPDTLVLGQVPLKGAETFTKTESAIEFGKEISWIADFDEAVSMGMGMKIELKDDFYLDPVRRLIDRIVVLGLYLSSDAEQSANLIGELLENHRYTEGLSILPQGTPTNNTENARAGFIPNEDPHLKGYYETPDLAGFESLPATDGGRLAKALGVKASVLAGIGHDDAHDHAEAVLMNTALYPATIGYYFDTLMDNYVPDEYLPLLKNFFVNHVTGAGPLPAIRVGDQPYGILVSSSFPDWKPASVDAAELILRNNIYSVLSFFNNQWDALSERVLFVGRERDHLNQELKSDDVLLDVVGLSPSSVRFERRTGLYNNFSPWRSQQPDFLVFKGEAENNQRTIEDQLRTFSGFTTAPLFAGLFFRDWNSVYIPEKNLLDGLEFDSEERLLPDIAEIGKNYLQWLSAVTEIDKLEKQDFSGAAAPNYLLYLLARHALLLTLREEALKLTKKNDILMGRSSFDMAYINFKIRANFNRELTIWEILNIDLASLNLSATDPTVTTLGAMLLSNTENAAGVVRDIKSKFSELSALPTARLERLLTGHLDCLTYRLDAWQSGMFFERLEQQRNDLTAQMKGTYLGAFGYLENLQPASRSLMAREQLPEMLRPDGETQVFEVQGNAGLLHAPSLDHAAAGALLMTGYRNHSSPADPGAFAVNLSSSRVRKATQILEGVRNGQSLEALLGYQFERACHEKTIAGQNLNQFVLAFRDKFPIENQYNKQEGEPDTDIFQRAPVQVVDGLKLINGGSVDIYLNIIQSVPAFAGDSRELVIALQEIVSRLADTLDAVKDLLFSEAVFQTASGNIARTGAVLEALREGNLPPEPGILKTPRRSRFSFHQILSIHFPQTPPDVSPWGNQIPLSARSQFEPGLNSWLAEIFGPPDKIACSVGHTDETVGSTAPSIAITLLDLGLQPVDFMMCSGVGTGRGPSELELRIANRYRRQTGVSLAEQVSVDLASANKSSGQRSFAEILPLVKALHTVFTESRAIHGRDYAPYIQGQKVNAENPHGYDVGDLLDRTKRSIKTLEETLGKLDNIVPNSKPKDNLNPESLNALFKQWEKANLNDSRFKDIQIDPAQIVAISDTRDRLSEFDLPSALQAEATTISDQSLSVFLADTAKVWRAGHQLLQNASAVLVKTESTEGIELKATELTKLVKLLLGGGFPAMPKFRYQNPADIQASFSNRDQLLKHYSHVSGLPASIIPENWLQSVSAVRSKSSQWELARSLAEMHAKVDITLQPIQLPFKASDSWLAVQFPKTDETTGKTFTINTETISCAVFGKTATEATSLQSGILIDEWSESIPVDTESTGIAFNYNQPDQMPPQTLLLAVCPGTEGNWTWDALLATVTDTFKRCKMRAVEPSHFSDNRVLRHFLPGVIAPLNISGNNISLDFGVASEAYLGKVPRDLTLYASYFKSQ